MVFIWFRLDKDGKWRAKVTLIELKSQNISSVCWQHFDCLSLRAIEERMVISEYYMFFNNWLTKIESQINA